MASWDCDFNNHADCDGTRRSGNLATPTVYVYECTCSCHGADRHDRLLRIEGQTGHHYDPTDALDALAQQQILYGICSEPTCQWPIAGWCEDDGCRAKLCYDHLQEHRNQHQPPPVRYRISAANLADAIEREALAVEPDDDDE